MREKIHQVIYKGQCIDNDDPLRLGRIRAYLKTDNLTNIEESNTYTPWDYNDPFVFLPLLPLFINTPPKNEEYVHLFYSNIDKKIAKDKYYIPGVFSSPTNIKHETYDSAVSNLEEGSRNKKAVNIKDLTQVKGVYAEPDDVGIYGRGDSDIIIKDNTVLLRSGKHKPFNRNETPQLDNKRSFLQLSKFQQRTVFSSPENKYRLSVNDTNIQKLIEYTITDPTNTFNIFSGFIYVYNVKKSPGYKSNSITPLTEITEKSLVTTISFSNKGIDEVSDLINQVLNLIIEKNSISDLVNDDTVGVEIQNNQNYDGGNLYPFYYRPVPIFYSQLETTNNVNVRKFITDLLSKIKTNSSQVNNGYGLVYNKNRDTNAPLDLKKETIIPKTVEKYDKSVGILGADELYLLSHQSQKFGIANKINMNNTLYGIDENKIADEIEPKTSSLVRGEELFELIDLIVSFLISHVHPYPGMAPVPVAQDGTRVDDILKELLNASEKVLNKKIRIN